MPFEGGEGRDIEVLIGSNTFIPGFEDQLVGAVAGEKRVVHATFPEAYAVRTLAGKTGDFDVTVKAVAAPEALAIDDEFASLGLDGLDKLREMFRDRVTAEYARVSRDKLKRQLLDKLDALYSFELPEGLVNQEFDGIWTQVMQEQAATNRSFADENTTEEAAQADYRRIAERRVRLGLLLAEVGTKADVKIADEEMTQALIARARQFPGQEKEVWDFYRKNQQALAELRAPIYEEKVVDHILGVAKVADRKVAKEELMKPLDDELPPSARPGEDAAAAAAEAPKAGGLTSGRRGQGPAARRRPAPLFGKAPDAYLGPGASRTTPGVMTANARSDRLLHQQSRADRDRAVGARRAVLRHFFAPPARADRLPDWTRRGRLGVAGGRASSCFSRRKIRRRTSPSTSTRRAAW